MLNLFHCALVSLILVGFSAAQLDAGQIPPACESPCQKLLDLANTCLVEYPAAQDSRPTATACLCNGISGLDYSDCTSCLGPNSSTLAQSLSQLSTFCTQFIDRCVYECSFETCPSSDIPCQCKPSYLQDIYDCAFCNSGHGNTNVTTLSDYTALSNSCSNQGQTDIPTTTDSPPLPSGTISYTGGAISLPLTSLATHPATSTSSTGASSSHSSSLPPTTVGTGTTTTATAITTTPSPSPTISSHSSASEKTMSSACGGALILLVSVFVALGDLF